MALAALLDGFAGAKVDKKNDMAKLFRIFFFAI